MSDENTPAELREQVEALTKDIAKERKAKEDLLKENRSLKARDSFREATLSPDLADLFVAVNPDGDISVEAAKDFAEKYGVGAAAAPDEQNGGSGDGTEPPAPNTQGLDLINRAGSGAGNGGQPPAGDKTMSVTEYVELLRRDKPAAQTALAEGRVRVRDDNPMARDRVNFGTENPFDRFNRDALQKQQS